MSDKRIELNERVLITTLTIRMAEELTDYLKKIDMPLWIRVIALLYLGLTPTIMVYSIEGIYYIT